MIVRALISLTAVVSVAGGMGVAAGPSFWGLSLAAEDVAREPRNGTEILDGFTCNPGERREVALRGVEDGFSSAGQEPAGGTSPAVSVAHFLGDAHAAVYDDPRPDSVLMDHFMIPNGVVRGVFVAGLKSIAGGAPDTILIGRASDLYQDPKPVAPSIFYSEIPKLGETTGWRRTDTLAWASMDDIRLTRNALRANETPPEISLLEFVREASGPAPIDVFIADDTKVDFLAFAYCVEPEVNRGLTVTFGIDENLTSGLVYLTRAGHGDLFSRGNPIVGDVACAEALPLVCFRNTRAPAPAALRRPGGLGPTDSHIRNWTGGWFRLSRPVRGDALKTASAADRFCQAEFGADWRVADMHSNGAGTNFVGFGTQGAVGQRAWMAVRDQPHGNCWARD